MAEQALVLEVLLILGAALAGGALSRALRLPTVVGFLLAGLAIGPGTPGPVADTESVRRAADIGVVLLMFTLGIQFSFATLVQHRRVIFLGGAIQIVATVILGILAPAFVVGFFAANTSTVVAVKMLEAHRQSGTDFGLAATNISILQDMCAVGMIIAVPSLAGASFAFDEVALAIPKGLLLVGATYVAAKLLLPWVWRRLIRSQSREVSLMGGLVLAIGLAALSTTLGLSIVFGAFLAGLALSENRFGYLTLSDIIPLRELFASVFFVSMGMLVMPEVVVDAPWTVLTLVVLIVAAKSLVSSFALQVAGLPLRSAVLAGLLLGQVGEFSFILASTALDEGVIGGELASAFLVAAVLSILVNPAFMALGLRLIPDHEAARALPHGSRHVVICGFDQSTRALARVLSGRGFSFTIIETNPLLLDYASHELIDQHMVFGDPAHPEIMERAGISRAIVLAVTSRYSQSAELIVHHAHAMNRRVGVVAVNPQSARVWRPERFSEVIDPAWQATMEMIRHVLIIYGVSEDEIRASQATAERPIR